MKRLVQHLQKHGVKHHHVALSALAMAWFIIGWTTLLGDMTSANSGWVLSGWNDTPILRDLGWGGWPEEPVNTSVLATGSMTGNSAKENTKCSLQVSPLVGIAPHTVRVVWEVSAGASFSNIFWWDETSLTDPLWNSDISHTYEKPGVYHITATITSDAGKKARCKQIVTVKRKPNVAVWSVWPTMAWTTLSWRTLTGSTNTGFNRPEKNPSTSSISVSREQRTERAFLMWYVTKTYENISNTKAIESVVDQFIKDTKELRAEYQNALSNGVTFSKDYWNTQVDTLIGEYRSALTPYIAAEKTELFETFLTTKSSSLKATYDRLELIRQVQLQKLKVGK